MERYDAIVLGTGGVGSAALYHLAQRGVRVLGIDRFDPPHDRGSSHGQTRVIRQAYFEHPDYVPLLAGKLPAVARVGAVARGGSCFTKSGWFKSGRPTASSCPACCARRPNMDLRSKQLVVRRRSNGVGRGCVPAITWSAVFEPTAGYLLVEDCVERISMRPARRRRAAHRYSKC